MVISPNTISNRSIYTATLIGALAVAATPLAHPAVAAAQRVLDVETYDNCVQNIKDSLAKGMIHIWDVHNAYASCCEYAGGTWNDTTGECVAPPADSRGSRQLPGNVRIPSDIATAPAVSTVSQGHELAA